MPIIDREQMGKSWGEIKERFSSEQPKLTIPVSHDHDDYWSADSETLDIELDTTAQVKSIPLTAEETSELAESMDLDELRVIAESMKTGDVTNLVEVSVPKQFLVFNVDEGTVDVDWSACQEMLGAIDWKAVASEGTHIVLDVAGLVPGFGNLADGAHVSIYLAEGKHTDAAISSAAMLAGPVGSAAAGSRVVKTLGKRGSKVAKALNERIVVKQAAKVENSAHSNFLFQKYKKELREQMSEPHVKDAQLSSIMKDLYKTNAEVGSGSTAAALRHEIKTGEPVKGRWHKQAAEERLTRLEKWLRKNPQAELSDRAAAENLIEDLKDALGK